MHGKPGASFKICGSHRLRLGEAPLHSPRNPRLKRYVGVLNHRPASLHPAPIPTTVAFACAIGIGVGVGVGVAIGIEKVMAVQ